VIVIGRDDFLRLEHRPNDEVYTRVLYISLYMQLGNHVDVIPVTLAMPSS